MKNLQNHIPFSQLVEYVEARLLPDQQTQLESHIASCSHCADQLGRLQRIIGFLQASEDAPASTIKSAVALFHHRPGQVPAFSGLRSRIVALLYFDSARIAPAPGIRSGKSGTQQLLFRADRDEIDLRIEPEGQRWLLSGQILGESIGAGTAVLEGEAGIHEVAINELSEFSLPLLQAGSYTLTLYLTDVDLEINELKVGP